jgi:AcrR family transcriptional regulator
VVTASDDAALALQLTQEKIVSAADPLFYERGIAAVSVDDIRAAAGVALKTMYRAFRSKDEIVIAYLTRRDLAWHDAVQRYVEERSDVPLEQLLLVFDAHERFLRGSGAARGCAFQQAFAELSASRPEAAAIARAHKLRVHAYLLDRARAADVHDPVQVATQLLVLSEGTLTVGALTGDPSVAQAAKNTARLLLEYSVQAGRHSLVDPAGESAERLGPPPPT